MGRSLRTLFVLATASVACCAAAAQQKPVARYDAAAKTLCFRTMTGFKCFSLSGDVAKPLYMDLLVSGKQRGAAFYSSAFYRSHNQSAASPQIILWEDAHSNQLFPKPSPLSQRLDGPAANSVLAQHAEFARIFLLIERHVRSEPGTRYCTGFDGGSRMLTSVLAGECYVDCWGRSVIAQDFLQGVTSTRLVVLQAPETTHADGVVLLQSETHATIELNDDGHWYVADPSFGFAYVLSAGRRLDAKGLIAALSNDASGKGLVFAAVTNAGIRFVPGDEFIRNNRSLSALNYTKDKRVKYTRLQATPTR